MNLLLKTACILTHHDTPVSLILLMNVTHMHLDPFGKERNSAGYYANKQGTVPVSPFYKQLDLSIFFRSRVQVASKALQNKHLQYIHMSERERGADLDLGPM